MNFLLNYIKDMKNETLHILVSQETAALLESFKVQPNELHKLSDEQLLQVKNAILANSGHSIYNTLRDNPAFSRFNYQLLNDTLSNIVDILAKKLPQEVSFNPTKLDAVIHRIKLVPIPKTVIEEDYINE